MFKNFFVKIIKSYQKFISPAMAHHCRFWPSCSEYSCQAINKYGILKGILLSFKRLLKCHPFCPGGVDLP